MNDLKLAQQVQQLETRLRDLASRDKPGNYSAGSVLFGGANGAATTDPLLVWDNTNKRFGIGLSAPNARLEIRDSLTNVPTVIISTNDAEDVNRGDVLGQIVFTADDNSTGSNRQDVGAIKCVAYTIYGTTPFNWRGNANEEQAELCFFVLNQRETLIETLKLRYDGSVQCQNSTADSKLVLRDLNTSVNATPRTVAIRFQARGLDATNESTEFGNSASIVAVIQPDTGVTVPQSYLSFYTKANGASPAEKVRIEAAGHVLPKGTAGTQNLGDATNYWGDISYKTLTDRGCLGWFDEGVEMPDGSKVDDLEALKRIRRHPSNETVYGVPMLDYTSMPKAVRKLAPIAQEDIYEDVLDEFGNVIDHRIKYRAGEKMGEDGAEITAFLSIIFGALKQADRRIDLLVAAAQIAQDKIQTLQAQVQQLQNGLANALQRIAALEARIPKP